MTNDTALATKWVLFALAIVIVAYYEMIRSKRKRQSVPETVSEVAFMAGVILAFADSFHLLGNFSESGLLRLHGVILACFVVGVIAILYGKLRGDPRRSSV